MSDQFFAITQVRIRRSPVDGATVTHAPAGSVLRWTGEIVPENTRQESGIYAEAHWMEVEYTSRWRRTYKGWTYEGWLEQVYPPAPVDPISEVVPILDSLRTPDPFDAQQYMVLNGKVAHNLCGEFCAAFLGGESIVSFLGKAQSLSPAAWEAGVKLDLGLGISAVERMLHDVYQFETVRFADGLRDPFVGALISPARIREKLEYGWMLLAGVKINGSSGKLISSGKIGHWVVLTNIKPYGVDNGMVQYYDPFSNRIKTVPYTDFKASMNSFSRSGMTGLWVPSDLACIPKEPVNVGFGQGSLERDVAKFLIEENKRLEDDQKFLGERRERIAALAESLE